VELEIRALTTISTTARLFVGIVCGQRAKSLALVFHVLRRDFRGTLDKSGVSLYFLHNQALSLGARIVTSVLLHQRRL